MQKLSQEKKITIEAFLTFPSVYGPFMSIWFLMKERENIDFQTVLKANLNDIKNLDTE